MENIMITADTKTHSLNIPHLGFTLRTIMGAGAYNCFGNENISAKMESSLQGFQDWGYPTRLAGDGMSDENTYNA
ncbi:MAG: hypothetical protein IPJ36_17890 [Simplicispira sp.]|nr:hypothetical protein [Simplicispira sp.]